MVRELKSFSELEDLVMQIPDNQLVVVDCYASWCGPCKKMAPVFRDIASRYPDVIFRKGDVEKINELSDTFHVTSMPSFIFIKDTKAIHKLTGAGESKLVKAIEKYK
jgi:thioredoxin 1